MSHVLVTGGAGYIGSHVCKVLAQSGYIPVTYDSLETGFKESVLYGPFEQGNLLESKRVCEVFAKYPIDGVIHMAALIEVNESIHHPLKYYENNVCGTLFLLKAMEEFGCKKIVFSSTAAVYGIPRHSPVSEEEVKNPINPYGSTKLFAEQLLERLFIESSICSCSLRYFNACGADLDGELGERKSTPSHLIPRVLNAALDGNQVMVYGDDYPTEDGSCIRDYVHVLDLASAHIRALEYLKNHSGAFAFNLGTSQGLSVFQIIRNAEKVVGKKIAYEIQNRREGDPPKLVASVEKAEKELGWSVRYSDPATILSSAYEWQKKIRALGKQ